MKILKADFLFFRIVVTAKFRPKRRKKTSR